MMNDPVTAAVQAIASAQHQVGSISCPKLTTDHATALQPCMLASALCLHNWFMHATNDSASQEHQKRLRGVGMLLLPAIPYQ